MFYLNIFLQYSGQYLKTKLQYRANFFLSFLSDLM
ncbi:ABC transporter permease, partial [Bacillus sp. AFS001701]